MSSAADGEVERPGVSVAHRNGGQAVVVEFDGRELMLVHCPSGEGEVPAQQTQTRWRCSYDEILEIAVRALGERARPNETQVQALAAFVVFVANAWTASRERTADNGGDSSQKAAGGL